MILLHVHNLTDITTYLQDCSDINVSHTIIRHNIPGVKLNKTNMLLQIQGRSVQQQIKAIFCHSVKFTSGKENEQQKDAEAYYHFQNLFLFFSPFFSSSLHQIEQTYIGTCKVNTLWCFS